ncbi:MAG: hypothetical protein PVG63_01440 [Anaerolineales bacterium]|jgi:hypothetical protein
MTANKILFLILVVFLIGGGSACNFTLGGQDCEPSQDDLPIPISPEDILVSSGRPTLEWTLGECNWDGLIVEVVPIPQPAGDFSNVTAVAETELAGSATSWTIDTDLDPASVYLWRVKPDNGMDMSEDFERYAWLAFWTGPVCTEDQLWAVELTSPERAEVVREPFIYLAWEWPDASCLPDGYFYEVSTSHTFDVSYRGGPIHPWPGNRYPIEVEDCQVYYWRVLAFVGDQGGNDVQSFFYTDFEGTCPNFSCDETQLVAPSLLSPVNSEVVDAFGSQMRYSWEYPDPACQPEGYLIEAYAGDDFDSAPLGSKFTLDTRQAYGPIPEIPNYIEFPDCTTFQWRVAALQGDSTGPFSQSATFSTDYTGACDVQSDLAQPTLAGMACLENDRMMASFRFLSAPRGDYTAYLGQAQYDCSTWEGSPLNLYCFGPGVSQNAQVQLRLVDTDTRDPLYDDVVLTPNCAPTPRASSCSAPRPDSDPCWIWFGEPTCQWICFN